MEALTEAVQLQEGAAAQQTLIRILETKQSAQCRDNDFLLEELLEVSERPIDLLYITQIQKYIHFTSSDSQTFCFKLKKKNTGDN